MDMRPYAHAREQARDPFLGRGFSLAVKHGRDSPAERPKNLLAWHEVVLKEMCGLVRQGKALFIWGITSANEYNAVPSVCDETPHQAQGLRVYLNDDIVAGQPVCNISGCEGWEFHNRQGQHEGDRMLDVARIGQGQS